ncbi:hypothetical protein CR513_12251, partial [Mucuna pruriens]
MGLRQAIRPSSNCGYLLATSSKKSKGCWPLTSRKRTRPRSLKRPQERWRKNKELSRGSWRKHRRHEHSSKKMSDRNEN